MMGWVVLSRHFRIIEGGTNNQINITKVERRVMILILATKMVMNENHHNERINQHIIFNHRPIRTPSWHVYYNTVNAHNTYVANFSQCILIYSLLGYYHRWMHHIIYVGAMWLVFARVWWLRVRRNLERRTRRKKKKDR